MLRCCAEEDCVLPGLPHNRICSLPLSCYTLIVSAAEMMKELTRIHLLSIVMTVLSNFMIYLLFEKLDGRKFRITDRQFHRLLMVLASILGVFSLITCLCSYGF